MSKYSFEISRVKGHTLILTSGFHIGFFEKGGGII